MELLSQVINGTRRGFRRLAVDVGQTSFFEGREFRTFKEWSVATTETYILKAVVPVDIVLWELGLILEAGSFRIETLVGGSEGGSFSEVLPIFPTNTMSERFSPAFTPQVALTAGGTHTGGLVLDVLRGKAADTSNFAASVGFDSGAERGIGANTYYFRVALTQAIAVLKARWEERP